MVFKSVVVFYNFKGKEFIFLVKIDSHEKKDCKSERRMPWLPEAKKDVVSCEKARGTANRL